jgi:hypothetical protein
MFKAVEKPVRWLERILRPCHVRLVEGGIFRRLHGAMIFICGALLLLPLPVPFTNFFPAVAVALLACAMLESDGRFSVAGAAVFGISLLYFALLFFGGAAIVNQIDDWWRSHLGPFPLSPD